MYIMSIIMRTSMNIPPELLDKAQKLSHSKTKTQVVILALEEFIQRRKIQELMELKGSLKEDYSYKKYRKKRS